MTEGAYAHVHSHTHMKADVEIKCLPGFLYVLSFETESLWFNLELINLVRLAGK